MSKIIVVVFECLVTTRDCVSFQDNHGSGSDTKTDSVIVGSDGWPEVCDVPAATLIG